MGKWLIVTVLVVGIALGTAAALYYYFGGKDGKGAGSAKSYLPDELAAEFKKRSRRRTAVWHFPRR